MMFSAVVVADVFYCQMKKFLNFRKESRSRSIVFILLLNLVYSCKPKADSEVKAWEAPELSKNYIAISHSPFTYLKSSPDLDITDLKSKGQEADFKQYCTLIDKSVIFVESISRPDASGHVKIKISENDKNVNECHLKEGYVYYDHLVPYKGEFESLGLFQSLHANGFCKYSWEEKPGHNDYAYEHVKYKYSNRLVKKQNVLLNNELYRSASTCQKSLVLRECFTRILDEGEGNSKTAANVRTFKTNMKKLGLDPTILLASLAKKETRMGTMSDKCVKGSCNGIGLLQIITAIDEHGKNYTRKLSNPAWYGIANNVKTNTYYSMRIINEKFTWAGIKGIWDLAFYYNGNPKLQRTYANNVSSYYQTLKKCESDDVQLTLTDN